MFFRTIAYASAASGTLLGGATLFLGNRPQPVAAESSQFVVETASTLQPKSAAATSQRQPASPPKKRPPIATPYPLRQLGTVPNLANLGIDERLFGRNGDRWALVSSLNQSLRYIQTPQARRRYLTYPVPGFTRWRVQKSLKRFRQMVLKARSAQELQKMVQKEFHFYESVGRDGRGEVAFTGYYVPVQTASRVKTAKYRYPLYKLPPGFSRWRKPHPTRAQLEGKDGLQSSQSQLRGQELVYLADRLQAFLIHVQGSSRLQLTDGTTMSVGYAGATAHEYSSIGKELVNDGKFTLDELTLPKVLEYFEQNPSALNIYLPRNKRFVFFKNTKGSPPLGSLGFPVTADRSIATDKSKMPPGALALIHTQLPDRTLQQQNISQFVLDQDTGSAIKGPGRVDVFLGTGDTAGDRAGLVNAVGKLYYLLLKD